MATFAQAANASEQNQGKITELSGVGLGLRHKHFHTFIEQKPKVPWLEVHTENFISPGSTASKYLDIIRRDYPISAHCVGLSLGSASVDCPVREAHLQKLKATIARIEPVLVSDHLSWSASDQGHYIPDLLPVPYTDEALRVMCDNIDHVQQILRRQILVENPSSYLNYADSPIPEWEFLAELAQRTGCGILLDINNLYVSAHNHGLDAKHYLNSVPVAAVQEMHLAGYSVRNVEDRDIYIDTHGHSVYDPVWQLYKKALERFGAVPTLIEWDLDVPEFSLLMAEKAKADVIFNQEVKS